MLLRKARKGGDSYGNEWPHDGAVVDVPDGQAADLLSIADAGFTVANAEDATPDEAPADEPTGEPAELTEPAPADPAPVVEAKPARRRAPRATAPPAPAE